MPSSTASTRRRSPISTRPEVEGAAGTEVTDLRTAGLYRIAAVSKLTGVPVPTLRMWERRHAVVEPARSSGNGRLYSREDVDRLLLLRAATEAGHAIGTVASLSDEQLRNRLSETPAALAARPPASQCQVLVCGSRLAARLKESWAGRDDLTVAATLPTLTSPKLAQLTPVDAVIVEAGTLQIAALPLLRQLRQRVRARVMIVVYGFTQRQALARLDQEGIVAITQPVEAAHLARICHMALSLAPATAATGVEALLMQPAEFRRYDEAFLAQMAQLPSNVQCECPNHLAELLTKLNAFEQYSLECESVNAADASIHSLLYSAASHCRALLEHALHQVLQHEGIADPTSGH